MADGSAGLPELKKFQGLLTDLFQFDSADLDFGIYRIMNHKRDVVRRFIHESLPDKVESALGEGPLAAQVQAQARLTEAERAVRETIGNAALNADGSLNDEKIPEQIRGAPVIAKYLAAKRDADDAIGSSRAGAAARIYNHLYAFFSRYYQDGDFISKRRYSRNNRYAIPYNGEEVYLHWANRDQYYVKSEERFYNYDWKAPNGVDVRFRLDNADVERNNVKGDKRFFLPLADKTEWDAGARVVSIPFEYRPLNASERADYKRRNTQDDINARALIDIPQALARQPDAAAALTAERRRNGGGEAVSHLQHHLRRYVARNNADFFIHKDLRGFLNRELDFYLKNEVLNLDDLAVAGLDFGEAEFQIMRLVKSVGGAIIDFLAQIEDFQKMLWEKRKFVTSTHYCIALNRIDPRFYPEIAANAAQWREWRDLGFSTPPPPQDHKFLNDNPTLTLDTRHFDRDFTDRLLASFDDLDGLTDGVLAHGDNYQALRLMQEKYVGNVKCIYIDPPYNTRMAPILYKNDYRHSTWMSLVGQGVIYAERCLTDNGVLCVAIDDEEAYNLKALLDALLGADRYAGTVVVQANPGGRDINTHLAISHDYCLFYSNPKHTEMLLPRQDSNASHKEMPFRRTGGLSSPLERENSEFAFYYDPDNLDIVGVGGKRTASYPAKYEPTTVHFANGLDESVDGMDPADFFNRNLHTETILPQFSNGDRGVWRWSDRQKIVSAIRNGDIFIRRNNRGDAAVTLRSAVRPTYKPKTIWGDSKYSATTHGTMLLQHIFGSKGEFSYPKSLYAVKDAIEATTYGVSDAVVLDYFAGSGTTGHAVINLNREDGGRRKFILVEMGEYFDTALLPRIKKAIFAPEWRDGKPKRPATPEEAERSPRVIKYITLESYEDALDGIRFDADAGQLPLEEFGEDYLLKYMLFWETKSSPVLLNAAKLTRPFSYKLRAHINGQKRERPVDIPETFNWLLGLNVSARRVHYDDDRRYLAYLGETRERPGKRAAVIWRDTEGWEQADFARDRRFVEENGLAAGADAVYVNGGSCIPDAKAIEPLFKTRMFSAATG